MTSYAGWGGWEWGCWEGEGLSDVRTMLKGSLVGSSLPAAGRIAPAAGLSLTVVQHTVTTLTDCGAAHRHHSLTVVLHTVTTLTDCGAAHRHHSLTVVLHTVTTH